MKSFVEVRSPSLMFAICPPEHAQVGLGAFELAQHFFLVPVPHYERDARSGDTGHKNHDRHDRVSQNSSLINSLHDDATEAYPVFIGLQNTPSKRLPTELESTARIWGWSHPICDLRPSAQDTA
jgi:hypothetical protein